VTTSNGPRTVAIIGGGFGGTMVAAGLLGSLPAGSTVVRLERRAGHVGRGVAYGTGDAAHQLNVPAGRMSARPDDPDGFVRWLAEHAPAHADPTGFAPRRLYGDYLQSVLAAAAAARPDVSLRTTVTEVTSVEPAGSGAVVHAEGCDPLRAHHVVLAVGPLPSQPRFPAPVVDAWDPAALDLVGADEPVLIIGCGLTAVDLALTRVRAGCRAPLHLLSRNALLPRPHGPAPAPASTPWLDELRVATSLAAATAVVHRAARADEPGWRSVMDSLRPVTASLWAGLDEADRTRFLRLLRRQWDVHRHRCPADNLAVLEAAAAGGRIVRHRGRPVGFTPDGDGLTVTVASAGSTATLRVSAAIDATGPQNRLDRNAGALWDSLAAAGLCRPGPCGLGLDTDDDGRVRDASGEALPWLSTLGPTRQGSRWESTAVPELRVQAAALADRLAAGAA